MAGDLKFLRYVNYSRPQKEGGGKNPKAITQAKEAIKYIEADREHHRNNPHLFDSEKDKIERQPFMKRIEDQPQYGAALFKWKLGVCEQERDELQLDYKEWTREFMARVEAKYRQKLDWCAAIHDDEGHPHVHILIRGKDDQRQHVNFRSYDIPKLNKLADETKRLQATRNLGPELAKKTMEKLEKIAAQIQAEKKSRGVPKSQSLGADFSQELAGSIQKIIRETEYEREQQEFKDQKKRERENKLKRKQKGFGR